MLEDCAEYAGLYSYAGSPPEPLQRPNAPQAGQDGWQTLTGRTLSTWAAFLLHCQPCQRVRSEPLESLGAEPLLSTRFYSEVVHAFIFYSKFFLFVNQQKSRQRHGAGWEWRQLPQLRQAGRGSPPEPTRDWCDIARTSRTLTTSARFPRQVRGPASAHRGFLYLRALSCAAFALRYMLAG
jgi:hypothetical protein